MKTTTKLRQMLFDSNEMVVAPIHYERPSREDRGNGGV